MSSLGGGRLLSARSEWLDANAGAVDQERQFEILALAAEYGGTVKEIEAWS